MKYNIYTNNIDLTELDQEHLENKLDRITKFVKNPYTTDVTFDRSTHHNKGQVVACKINITQGKKLVHAERTGSSIQDALDETIAAVKQSLTKIHEKRKRSRFSIRNIFKRD